MELIVADFCDPVSTVVIIKGQDRPISLSQVPDSHSAISSTRCHRVQPTLIVGQVKHLIHMGRETKISCPRSCLTQI